MNSPNSIVGAGLAGLIAAHVWPRTPIHERGARPDPQHKALLRFRTDAVAKITGIDFRRVRVHKSIWDGKQHCSPDIRQANLYARKVVGALAGERSVWSVEPADRWVAPEDFYARLVENVESRVLWGSDFSMERQRRWTTQPIVSTAPLPATLAALGLDFPVEGEQPAFARAPIRVRRFRVPGADVFQTVYFTNPCTAVYRASITGSMLIVESVVDDSGSSRFPVETSQDVLSIVGEAFALGECDPIDDAPQAFGKIVPLPDALRKALLYKLTTDHGVYSLGRFATWRNVLLDDVVQDIAVLKKLFAADSYSARLRTM